MPELKTMHQSLSVTPTGRLLGLESFRAENLWTPPGNRGVFGGQVIGQALMAAIKTVEGKDLHSQHCYFLLPCDSRVPVTYAVERLRDGKSYVTRLVHAIQNSETIFILMASFTTPPMPIAPAVAAKVSNAQPGDNDDDDDDGPVPFATRYQRPAPQGIKPFAVANDPEHRWKDYVTSMGDFGVRIPTDADTKSAFVADTGGERPLMAIRGRGQSGKNHASRTLWLQPRLSGSRMTPNEIRAMIGYMTDSQTVATASRTIGLNATSDPRLGMVATIDHTIHFYPFPPSYDGSQPVLHVIDAVAVDLSAGRGVVTGRVYTEDGVLIATTSQEGVVRAQTEGKRPRKETARL